MLKLQSKTLSPLINLQACFNSFFFAYHLLHQDDYSIKKDDRKFNHLYLDKNSHTKLLNSVGFSTGKPSINLASS